MAMEIKGRVLYFETGRMKEIVSALKSDQKVLPVPEIFKIVFEISSGPMRLSIVTMSFDAKRSQEVAALFNMQSHRIHGPDIGDVTQYHLYVGNDSYKDMVRLDHTNKFTGHAIAKPQPDFQLYLDMVFHR